MSGLPNASCSRYVLFLLLLAHIVAFLDRQVLALMVDPVKQELALSDTQMGLLLGFAFALFYTAMGIPLGRLADRTNRTRLIAAGIALWSVMTALCGLAKSFSSLLLARIGVGVGEASLGPCAYSLIADLFPREERSRAVSLFALGPFIGAGVAFLVGGMIISAVSHGSGFELPLLGEISPWRLVLLIIAVPGLVLGIFILFLKEPARLERMHSGPGTSKNVSLRFAALFIKAHVRVYGCIFFGFSFIALMTFAYFAWIPTLLVRVHGFGIAQAGFIFGTLLLVFGATGTFCGGVLADRLIRKGSSDGQLRIGIMAALVMSVLGVITSSLSESNSMLVFLALTLFAHGVPVGMAPSALQAITPNEMRGQVIAVFNLTVSIIGIGMGPFLVAVATDYLFRDPLALGSSLALISAVAGSLAIAVLLIGRKAYQVRMDEWLPQSSDSPL